MFVDTDIIGLAADSRKKKGRKRGDIPFRELGARAAAAAAATQQLLSGHFSPAIITGNNAIN